MHHSRPAQHPIYWRSGTYAGTLLPAITYRFSHHGTHFHSGQTFLRPEMAFTLKHTVYSRLGLKPHTSLPAKVRVIGTGLCFGSFRSNTGRTLQTSPSAPFQITLVSRKRSRKFLNQVQLAAFLGQGRQHISTLTRTHALT